MIKDYSDYIKDIADSINDINNFTGGMTHESFISDKKTVNAVIRSLEIIGEASKKLPDDIKNRAGEIPWKKMAGMRDRLIHEYSGVDIDMLWQVVIEELPKLESQIKKLL